MRNRAAEQHPDVFVALKDEALLEKGRRRRGLVAAAEAKQQALMKGAKGSVGATPVTPVSVPTAAASTAAQSVGVGVGWSQDDAGGCVV
jgi:hypothetical protein